MPILYKHKSILKNDSKSTYFIAALCVYYIVKQKIPVKHTLWDLK